MAILLTLLYCKMVEPTAYQQPKLRQLDKIVSKPMIRPVSLASPDNDKKPENLQEHLSKIDKKVVKWTLEDPDACLLWALALDNVLDKQTALTSIYLTLLDNKNLSKALEILNQIPKGEFRDNAIVFGISRCMDLDFDEAISMTSQISGKGMIKSAARDIASKLLEPKYASRLQSILEDLPYGEFRNFMASELIGAMSRHNPGDALLWLNSQENFPMAQDAIVKIGHAFGGSDPIGGILAADNIMDGRAKEQFLIRLGTTWARSSPSEAGSWLIKSVNDSGYIDYSAISKGLLSEWVQWDHDDPFEKINQINDADDRRLLTLETAQHLAKFDPLKASTVINSFVELPDKATLNAVREVARNWLQRDSIQASAWISNLRSGDVKDASIEVLVDNILRVDADAVLARKWASQISSSDRMSYTETKISDFMSR